MCTESFQCRTVLDQMFNTPMRKDKWRSRIRCSYSGSVVVACGSVVVACGSAVVCGSVVELLYVAICNVMIVFVCQLLYSVS